MEIVLKKLGNPHKKLPYVIHVAGTNGKGSSVALIAKILEKSGKKVHSYTSPHLHDCNERIVLAGQKISDNFLFEIMEETRLAAESTPLTFMESFTIGAFLAFSKVPADFVVIEAGMGGRIDATNIIEQKIATVITPISFDHVEYLGNSIERIALEKAMIMRPKTPLIVASQPSLAKNIIKILADDQKIPTYFYGEDFAVEEDEESGRFDFYFQDYFFQNLPKPALLGSHQYINFATAIAAVLTFSPLSSEVVADAVVSVFWPSRLEKITNGLEKILPPKSELRIDGAHNEGGAFALAKWITKNPWEKNFIICGFSRNKCKSSFLEKFKDIAEVVAVRVNGEPYPEEAEKISAVGKEIGMKIAAFSDLIDALNYISKTSTKPCRVIICGSLHLARDVKKPQ